MSEASGSQSIEENLFAEYLLAREKGIAPPFESWVLQHGAHAEVLREMHRRFEERAQLIPFFNMPGEPAMQREGAQQQPRGEQTPGAGRSAQGSDARPGAEDVTDVLDRLKRRTTAEPRYERIDRIGKGGMGVIFKVHDLDLRRTLAMKVALRQKVEAAQGEHWTFNKGTVSRFLDEAQITGQLDHPGVIPVHELGIDADDQLFFTMRLVQGESLLRTYQRVAEGDSEWTTTRVLGVLLRVCETLAYAHSKGVIHRDLKPENIMVGRFGEVYVMDWGLATIVSRRPTRARHSDAPQSESLLKTQRALEREQAPGSPLLTEYGQVLGTPAYMPPEQALGETDVLSPQSDIYALGAMLYHLLLVKHIEMPYVNRDSHVSLQELLELVRKGPPAPISSYDQAAPEPLCAIVAKAMQRAPEERYGSMLDLAADIRAYLEHRPISVYRPSRWKRWEQWTALNSQAFALSIIALGIITVPIGFRLYSDRPQTLSPFAFLTLACVFAISCGTAVLVDRQLPGISTRPLRLCLATLFVFLSGALLFSLEVLARGGTCRESLAWASMTTCPKGHPADYYWILVPLTALIHVAGLARLFTMPRTRAALLYAGTVAGTFILGSIFTLTYYGGFPLSLWFSAGRGG